MKVVIVFGGDADIIEMPDTPVDGLKKYERDFDKWIHDRRIKHGYWERDGKRILGVNYRADAFVEWLNTFVFKEEREKAKVLETAANEYEKTWLCLFF